jgi:hypothetical protein
MHTHMRDLNLSDTQGDAGEGQGGQWVLRYAWMTIFFDDKYPFKY